MFAGLGYGTIMPAAQSISVGVGDKREFGSAFSTLFLFVGLGFGFGPMHATLSGIVVLAAVFYLFTHARTEHANHGFIEVKLLEN
ncbi:hypothetical protein [Corynebacterium deserti]|uniref:hypothetical protein n=1 Tax=Corynebacterium deserti TaxID=1408191 RepID=UPI000B10F1BF|nr:hypothetical protein [Corynebacterium deserti]